MGVQRIKMVFLLWRVWWKRLQMFMATWMAHTMSKKLCSLQESRQDDGALVHQLQFFKGPLVTLHECNRRSNLENARTKKIRYERPTYKGCNCSIVWRCSPNASHVGHFTGWHLLTERKKRFREGISRPLDVVKWELAKDKFFILPN